MNFPDLFEKKCAVCGKKLFPTPYWVYKRQVKGQMRWFCSYSCDLKDAKGSVDGRRYSRFHAVEMLDAGGAVLREFEHAAAAAKAIGCKPDGIRKCCRGQVETYCGNRWRYKEVSS